MGVDGFPLVTFLAIACCPAVVVSVGDHGTDSVKRNVTVSFNEGCNITFCQEPTKNSFVNIFHIVATGENDTMHFLWSSYGALTGIVARTKLNAELVIDWEKLKNNTNNAIHFEPDDAVLFSSAIIFSRLIEFNDVNDTARLTLNHTVTKAMPFEDFTWNDFSKTIDRHNISGVFTSPYLAKEGTNDSVSLTVQGFGDNGRSPILPRLLHDSNSSYFELLLNNLTISNPRSRFAVELVFVDGDHQRNGTDFITRRSIADQYTPAVFYVDNIMFAKPNTSRKGGFVSWKPITYTEESRHLTNGRTVQQYGLKTANRTDLPGYSIAHAFYGDLSRWDLSAINVSFGNDGDGFYTASNYTVWGGLIGYGEPQLDSLSLMIIIVISAGLGIPALLILCGGSVLCVIRLKIKKNREGPLLIDPSVN